MVYSLARAILHRVPLARHLYAQVRYKIPKRVLYEIQYKIPERAVVIAMVPLRVAARRRRTQPGVTVVIATWNSLRFLRTTIAAVREYGGSHVHVTVVDNHSTDGVHRFLRLRYPDVRLVRLPVNIRHVSHALAMDIGFLLARTEYVVSLDVDAFPISRDWLPTLLDPLTHGYKVSGVLVDPERPFAHPCCLAMRFRDFVDGRHTFSWNMGDATDVGVKHWDTGELISMREKGRVAFIGKSAVRGPGIRLGSVFGDILYHNFYSTLHEGHPDACIDIGPPGELRVGRLSQAEVLSAWEEAKAKYLPHERCAAAE